MAVARLPERVERRRSRARQPPRRRARLPPLDWLWLAAQRSDAWVESDKLAAAFDAEVSAA